jgi:hypothetical protein
MAWAAGAHRWAAPGSRIGVHNAAFNAGQSFDRLAAYDTTGAMARWFYDHGAPDNVVNKTLDTPADAVYWLTADDLATWNVRSTP